MSNEGLPELVDDEVESDDIHRQIVFASFGEHRLLMMYAVPLDGVAAQNEQDFKNIEY